MSGLKRFWHRHHRRIVRYAGVKLMILSSLWLFGFIGTHQTEPIDSFVACAEEGNPISDSNPARCHDRDLSYLGPVATPAAVIPSPHAAQPFDVLVSGDSGGDYPRREEVIRTQAAWRDYWNLVHADLPHMPPLIPVDFTARSVVAVSSGPKPSSGYGLKITALTAAPESATINIRLSEPTKACLVEAKSSNRYLIISTPKLPAAVEFIRATQPRQC